MSSVKTAAENKKGDGYNYEIFNIIGAGDLVQDSGALISGTGSIWFNTGITIKNEKTRIDTMLYAGSGFNIDNEYLVFYGHSELDDPSLSF